MLISSNHDFSRLNGRNALSAFIAKRYFWIPTSGSSCVWFGMCIHDWFNATFPLPDLDEVFDVDLDGVGMNSDIHCKASSVELVLKGI